MRYCYIGRYVRLPRDTHSVQAVRRSNLQRPPVLLHADISDCDRDYCSGFVTVLRNLTYTHSPGCLITFRTEFELWNTRVNRCIADELRQSANTKMNRRSFPVRSEAENEVCETEGRTLWGVGQ